ncbi:unnamed protein product [Ambrosiozyma monospora]|uniref:Unnamed protein product n=1 Tax=Ambrosiozyma monospora TaxID=43982 RepID=A0A9W6YT29_AMBMO|nr:unnamed protein product [Ambrosiozyma monospora]
MDLFSIQQQNTNSQFQIHEDSIIEQLKVEPIWDGIPVSKPLGPKTLREREQIRQLENETSNVINSKPQENTSQEQLNGGVYTMQLWKLYSNSLMPTETGNRNGDGYDELDTHFTRLVLFIGSQCRLQLLVDRFNYVNMKSRTLSIIDGDFNDFENDERITLNFVRINLLADEWALEVLGPAQLQNVTLLFEKVCNVTVIDLFGKISVVLSDTQTLGNNVKKNSLFHANIPGNLFTILETTFKYLNVETLIEKSTQARKAFAESFSCYKPPSSTTSIVMKENPETNYDPEREKRSVYHTKYEHGNYRKIIKVKHKHVRFLLGNKGARITRIRKRTKVHIKIMDDDKENGFQGNININGWPVDDTIDSYQSICLTGEEKEVNIVEKMLLTEIKSGFQLYI